MDPVKENGPGIVGAIRRPELKPCVVGDSSESLAQAKAIRQALTSAASAALPIGETDAQAFGTRSQWGTHTRPGRIEARNRAIRALVRAAELALNSRQSLEVRHIEAALRSLAFTPADLLVCTLTGKWLSTRTAVAKRGQEISRAIEELALIVHAVESEVENG